MPTDRQLTSRRGGSSSARRRARAAERSSATRSATSRQAPLPDVNRYVYLLKLAAVQIRSVDSDALVMKAACRRQKSTGRVACSPLASDRTSTAWRSTVRQGDDDEPFRSVVQRMAALVEREKPAATMLLGPILCQLTQWPRQRRVFWMHVLRRWARAFSSPPSPATPRRSLPLMTAASHVVPISSLAMLVALDERTSDLRYPAGAGRT